MVWDDVAKDGLKALPAWARHVITISVIVSVIVGGYYTKVAGPVEAATATNNQQDTKIAKNSDDIEKIRELLAKAAELQATTTANVAAIQENQARSDQRQQRIEDKLDSLIRHQ